jgi:hypothetical protein
VFADASLGRRFFWRFAMWVLIVVTAFYQRSVQPEVVFHDFGTQEQCQIAANWTARALRDTTKDIAGGGPFNFEVQCERKG